MINKKNLDKIFNFMDYLNGDYPIYYENKFINNTLSEVFTNMISPISDLDKELEYEVLCEVIYNSIKNKENIGVLINEVKDEFDINLLNKFIKS